MNLTEVSKQQNSNPSFSKYSLLHLTPHDQMLFEKFGQGVTVTPDFQYIHHAFENQVKSRPEAIAAVHFGQSITYKNLNEQANSLAMLLANRGVVAGDHVGLFIERSIPMLVGILAILKLGAAYVPQDIRTAPPDQLLHVVKTAKIKIVLTLNKFMQKIPQDMISVAIDQEIPSSSNVRSFNSFHTNNNLTCFVLFTSGTTGLPNGVKVSHENVCNILLTSPGNLGIRPGYKVSQILSIAFDMAAWEILGSLSHGGTLLIRGKDIEETAKQADVIIATPSILSQIDIAKCKNIKYVAVAGEPCPRPLADKWASICDFYNSCGPTEVTIVNTMQLHKPDKEKLSIGKPTPNNTVYILNEQQQACAIGEIGEMWAGGKCVSQGYIGNDQLNVDRYKLDPFLADGSKMFRTRDLGRWTTDGELEHFGRTDDQVKIRGFRVELDSVSNVLESVPDCKQAVTLKLNDRHLVAFVTPKNVDTDLAKKIVAEKLPYYCTPALIMALDVLPTTSRGKIDKRLLTSQAVKEQERRDHAHLKLPPQKSLFLKISKNPLFMPYNRLAMLVALINFLMFSMLENLNNENISFFILGNFLIAVSIRQQDVINLLFKIATSAPHHWPLKIRWALGKVYHFGGIHVGSFFSATLWFAYFIFENFFTFPKAIVFFMLVHLSILIGMSVMALPQVRAKHHDAFELTARFGSWSSLYFLWFQTFLLPHNNLQLSIVMLLTFLTALPWLRMKKVKVDITTPSKHVALTKFNYGVTPFAGSSTDVSRSPLYEWHSFANIPSPSEEGFRLTISRAGDWTGKLIDEKPSHVWVKGKPAAGVGNIEKLFKKVIWVATGSGIGPCLPHLLKNDVPSILVWSTKNPRKTYGDALVDEILKVQPHVVIWDTDTHGKPDLVKLAYQVFKDSGAEAVICIANKKVTWQVNEAFETRGIPAFGAIWDS